MVFQLAGAIAGSLFTKAVGASSVIGWIGGSLLGSLLDRRPTIEGPRLEDLTVTTAEYGTDIPTIIGTDVTGGIMIWAPPLIEDKKTRREGGFLIFGGTKIESYRYLLNCQIALTDHEIEGVGRIWINDQLVADLRAGVNDPDIEASTAKFLAHFTLFRGTLDQNRDENAIRFLGENVPAYTGISYASIKNLDLTPYQQQPPRFLFEVIGTGTTDPEEWQQLQPSNAYWEPRSQMGIALFQNSMVIAGGISDVADFNDVWRTVDGFSWEQLPAMPVHLYSFGMTEHSPDYVNIDPRLYQFGGLFAKDFTNYTYVEWYGELGGFNQYIVGYALENARTWIPVIMTADSNDRVDPFPRDSYGLCEWKHPEHSKPALWLSGGRVNIDGAYPAKPTDATFSGFTRDLHYSPDGGFTWHRIETAPKPTPGGDDINLGYRHGHTQLVWKGTLWCIGGDGEEGDADRGNNVLRFNYETGLFEIMTEDVGQYVSPPAGQGDVWGALVWREKLVVFIQSLGQPMKTVISDDGVTWEEWTLNNTLPEFDNASSTGAFPGIINQNEFMFVLGGDNAGTGFTNTVNRSTLPIVSKGSVTLDQAVKVVSTKGTILTDSDIDVTDLEGIEVDGFTVPGEESPASTLERLMPIYAFDTVYSNGLIKYIKRGHPSSLNIPQKDIAAFPDKKDPESPEDYFSSIVNQPFDLPVAIRLRYRDRNSDFAINMANSKMLTVRNSNQFPLVESKQVQTIEAPIVLTADKAEQAVHTILWDAWRGRNKIPMTTDLSYIKLEGGDVVTLLLDFGQFICRVEEKNLLSKSLLAFTLIIEDLNLYTVPASLGQPIESIRSPIRNGVGSISHLIDTSIMGIPQFNDFGFFFATAPDGDENDWSGTYPQQRVSNFEDFQNISFFDGNSIANLATPIGRVIELELHSGASHLMIDKGSSIVVELQFGKIVQRTPSEVFGGLCRGLFGKEIMGYLTVEDLGNNQYRLTDLLRGLDGTDTLLGTHLIDEVVIIFENLQRIPMSTNKNVGREIDYRLVPQGFDESQVDYITFTNNALGKKPYAPGLLQAEKLSNGDWYIEWVGRSRFDSNWGSTVQYNPSYDEEEYILEFYDSNFSTILFETRAAFPIYRVAKRNHVLTLGKQLEVFGTDQNNIYIRIYQYAKDYPLDNGKGYAVEGSY